MRARLMAQSGGLSGIGALGVGLRSRTGTDPVVPSPWSTWSNLRLATDPCFLFSGEITIQRSDDGIRRVFSTVAHDRFPGTPEQVSRTRSVLEARTGLCVEYQAWGGGTGRRYRFDSAGYAVESFDYDGTPDAPPTGTRVRTRHVFAAPPIAGDADEAPRLATLYGLLHGAIPAGLESPGDTAHVWLATPVGPRPLQALVDDVETNLRAYRDADGVRRTGAFREIVVRLSPWETSRYAEGLLVLDHGLTVRLEAATRTPVEIQVSIPGREGLAELSMTSLG